MIYLAPPSVDVSERIVLLHQLCPKLECEKALIFDYGVGIRNTAFMAAVLSEDYKGVFFVK